ncbi:dihydrofolate reductase family protein [Isoptericola sp. NEAU-Y5]|uniref:Dihydrofolate reductase family protein n=1 Tax=Isoptericola luteus TaxID=2879484 RepID=A0ABS7ZGQ6_9MICO|nr:dihydrofolate reductase family protein [Isoptericola sp. NEAU-Y5]MCA5894210.1 dihydrofolate reductase family protein [Isoptericola sp. NEAU-Y5]
MRRLTYFVALSIDGFLSGPDDEVDFYPSSDAYSARMIETLPDVLPTHVRSQLGVDDEPQRTFDTVVMGRRTYQPALDLGITSPYKHLRQYVVSTSQPELDADVTIVRDDPVGLVRALKAEDSPLDIYLAGGGILAGALLDEIDRLVVKLYPVVAGAGRSAFGSVRFRPTRYDLTDVVTFEGGNAVLTYDRG